MTMRKLGSVTGCCTLAAILIGQPSRLAAQDTSSIWSVVPTPNHGPNNILLGISADSENDIWAAGDLVSLHFDGSKWSAIPVVGVNSGTQEESLRGVAALAPNNVWAVGSRFIGSSQHNISVIEHFDGTKWTVVASPHFKSGDVLNGVHAISANDIYAVGSSRSDNATTMNALIEHWDGSKWSVVPAPQLPVGQGIALNSLAVISSSDIWAVGSSGGLLPLAPFAAHFDGRRWTPVTAHTAGPANFAGLQAVAAIATDDVWAVGLFEPSDGVAPRTLTEHWDGKQWNVVPSPNADQTDNELFGVSAISSTDVWACGSSGGGFQVVIEHWDGTQWTISPSPQPNAPSAHAVLAFPSGSVFVAGSTLSPAGGFNSLILHTTQGL